MSENAPSIQKRSAPEKIAPPPELTPYTLLVPISVGGVERRDLQVRRPKFRDIKAAQAQGEESETSLLASMCDITLDAVNDMDMADVDAIQDMLRGFRNARLKR